MASVAVIRSLWFLAVLVAAVLGAVLSGIWLVGFILAFLGAALVFGRFPFRSLAPGGRFEWMMSWPAARQHPWGIRGFLFISFAAIAVLCSALVGETRPFTVTALALVTGLLGATLPNLPRRTGSSQHAAATRRGTFMWISLLFLLGAIVGLVTGSAAIAGCLIGLGAAGLAVSRRNS